MFKHIFWNIYIDQILMFHQIHMFHMYLFIHFYEIEILPSVNRIPPTDLMVSKMSLCFFVCEYKLMKNDYNNCVFNRINLISVRYF